MHMCMALRVYDRLAKTPSARDRIRARGLSTAGPLGIVGIGDFSAIRPETNMEKLESRVQGVGGSKEFLTTWPEVLATETSQSLQGSLCWLDLGSKLSSGQVEKSLGNWSLCGYSAGGLHSGATDDVLWGHCWPAGPSVVKKSWTWKRAEWGQAGTYQASDLVCYYVRLWSPSKSKSCWPTLTWKPQGSQLTWVDKA